MGTATLEKPTKKRERSRGVDVFEEVNAAFELPERKLVAYAGTLKGSIGRSKLVYTSVDKVTPKYLEKLREKHKPDEYVYFEEGLLPSSVGERIGASLRKAKLRELLEALESRYVKK